MNITIKKVMATWMIYRGGKRVGWIQKQNNGKTMEFHPAGELRRYFRLRAGETMKFYSFDSMDIVPSRIQEAFSEIEGILALASFHRDPRTGHYGVRHQGLEIGKIRRIRSRKAIRITGEDIHMSMWNRHASNMETLARLPKSSKIYYYWILDQNLCKFLNLNYVPNPNNITLDRLKEFVRLSLSKQIPCNPGLMLHSMLHYFHRLGRHNRAQHFTR